MRKADDLIQRFLDSIGQTDGSVYVGLFKSWQPIVGERIAAHAQPVDVRGHSLVIEADHPGWVQMVIMRRGRIIQELQRRFPQLGITGLTVRVVDRPGQGKPGSDRPPSPQPRTPETPPQSDGTAGPAPPPPTRDEKEALERIDDEDLRDVLSRLRSDLDEADE